jgi:hypothetical protein
MAVFTEEVIPTSQETPILHGKWDLYFHLPNDKDWNLSSYKIINKNITNVDELINLNEYLSEKIVKYCMLFVMRSGITPMWEDPKNRMGGCFSYKVSNKYVYDIWKTLFYSLCGETLCKNVKRSPLLNGITISPKKNFCIVKIWLSNCSLQDPSEIIDIPNLSTQGCLFRKHEPEF